MRTVSIGLICLLFSFAANAFDDFPGQKPGDWQYGNPANKHPHPNIDDVLDFDKGVLNARQIDTAAVWQALCEGYGSDLLSARLKPFADPAQSDQLDADHREFFTGLATIKFWRGDCVEQNKQYASVFFGTRLYEIGAALASDVRHRLARERLQEKLSAYLTTAGYAAAPTSTDQSDEEIWGAVQRHKQRAAIEETIKGWPLAFVWNATDLEEAAKADFAFGVARDPETPWSKAYQRLARIHATGPDAYRRIAADVRRGRIKVQNPDQTASAWQRLAEEYEQPPGSYPYVLWLRGRNAQALHQQAMADPLDSRPPARISRDRRERLKEVNKALHANARSGSVSALVATYCLVAANPDVRGTSRGEIIQFELLTRLANLNKPVKTQDRDRLASALGFWDWVGALWRARSGDLSVTADDLTADEYDLRDCKHGAFSALEALIS